ncbi:sensor histidine kinase [Methylobacterium gnaphalii]|uniref:sensor histidine kinase n=1 Tax=Methylobacterium gnaphalii TaxID=1010610 RepID=UPI001EE1AF96|nr:HWE histidine kinase domain-containing protein [Methylobacterium gnaphalii]
MLESTIVSTGISRIDRRAILEAENAYLRKLLAQRPLSANDIYVNAERRQAEETGASRSAAALRSGSESEEMRSVAAEEINAQLRATEEFNRRILASTTDCITVLDIDGRVISMNEVAIPLFGRSGFAHAVGKHWSDMWQLPESREAVLRAFDEARAGRTSRFQAALYTGAAGDALLWWDIVVAPMNGDDGRPERLLAVSRDITELKQTEARQTVLMQEMAHRVKNTLAMVQAVATQTLRNAHSLEEAGEALGARLLALAQAHDVLMQGSWSSADLRGLVDTAVALHSDGEPGRFVVSGPDVTLGPRPGLTLALILHELGTNAAKYGALSKSEGHVEIRWSVETVDAEERLSFRWEEIDGPAVTPPTRIGFGSRLIERSLVHSFGGSAKLDFPETGVVLTMQAPAANVVVPPAA